MSARDIHEICVQCIVTDFRETKVDKDPFGAKFTVVLYSMYFANIFNPLVPDRTLKYVISEKSFRYFFSHNTSISYSILKI